MKVYNFICQLKNNKKTPPKPKPKTTAKLSPLDTPGLTLASCWWSGL
jgi:hypothetical protein